MTNNEKIEFYARAYNTIQEIARTAQNNDDRLKYSEFATAKIDEKIIKWDFTDDQKNWYRELTRTYFIY